VPDFYVSPSQIARYYFHECERYLRYRAATRAKRQVDGIPEFSVDRSLLTRAILEGGAAWEQQLLHERLAGRVHIAPGSATLSERRHTPEATVQWLRTAGAGDHLYQATLRAPSSFYGQYGIDRNIVEVTDCYPDLIAIVPNDGRLELRVIDAKASEMMKLSHRIQVGVYSLILEAVVADANVEGRAVGRLGGVWLYQQPEPEWFELARVRGQLEAFLSHDLARIMALDAHDAPWHLYFRCEWCDYYEHCRAEAEDRNDVSLVPYLSTFAKRHLAERSVSTVNGLGALLDRPDADAQLAGCASLEGRAGQLRSSVAALLGGTPIGRQSQSIGMPKGEHIAVMLTLQSEPLQERLYGFAINRVKGNDVYGSPSETIVRVAPDPTPATLAQLRSDLVADLRAVLDSVDAFNRTHTEWREQKTVQVFVFDGYERTLLVESLLDAVLDPSTAHAALELLFYFQHPDLVQADDHPATEVFFPVITIVDVLRGLIALPIPVVYRFGDVVDELQPSNYGFTYDASDFYNFALSNRLKSNAIFEIWERGRDDLIPNLERELQRRVWALSSVINGLRERLEPTGALFAWPPKFFFPDALRLSDPTLSRLAFIARYEAVLRYLETRSARGASEEDRLARGVSAILEFVGAQRWRVDPDQIELMRLEPSTFSSYLVTPTSDAGRRARVAYDDFAQRQRNWAPKHLDVSLASVISVGSGEVGLKLTSGATFTPPSSGDRYVLDMRWTDWTTDRLVTDLVALDGEPHRYSALLRDPVSTRRPLRTSPAIRDRALEVLHAGRSTPSQTAAFTQLLDYDVQATWGPPGTGKTHFLALAILALLEAHRADQQPLRVVVTAFTNAAIDNVMRKIHTIQSSAHLLGGDVALLRVNASCDGCRRIDRDSVPGAAVAHDHAVFGTTVWQFHRTDPASFRADMVVIDEASQLTAGQAVIAWRRLTPGGRFVVAGDPEQLPPIVAGAYPLVGAEPPLHRSILECLRTGDPDGASGLVTPLLENWRMNAPLCAYPAASIYPPDYRPATAAIATARLGIDPAAIGGPAANLLRLLLDPGRPMVMCVFEDVHATRENPAEAELATELAAALRAQSSATDDEFWREELFIVGPHHAQNRLIRHRLADVLQSDRSFVDTVDKMQGQECNTVIVSYGVSDVEYALGEQEFIYQRNRLNVAITRARHKTIVLISRRLLDPPIQALEQDAVADGISYMQGLVWHCEEHGDVNETRFGAERVTVYRR
jgi:hypothetical protein